MIEVIWSEPAEPNGIIRSYIVYIVKQPDISLGDSPATETSNPIVKVLSI